MRCETTLGYFNAGGGSTGVAFDVANIWVALGFPANDIDLLKFWRMQKKSCAECEIAG
jgi:hypothetical protein